MCAFCPRGGEEVAVLGNKHALGRAPPLTLTHLCFREGEKVAIPGHKHALGRGSPGPAVAGAAVEGRVVATQAEAGEPKLRPHVGVLEAHHIGGVVEHLWFRIGTGAGGGWWRRDHGQRQMKEKKSNEPGKGWGRGPPNSRGPLCKTGCGHPSWAR